MALGRLADTVTVSVYLPRTALHGYSGPQDGDWAALLAASMRSALIWGSTVVRRLMPEARIGTAGFAGPVVALAFLCAAIPLSRRLKVVASEPGYAGPVAFLRGILLPLVVISLAEVVACPVAHVRMLHAGLGRTSASMPLMMALAIPPAIYSAAISAVVIGGLAGSLERMKRHRRVTAETFFRDAVRLFKPVAGVYLLLGVVGLVIIAPSVYASCHTGICAQKTARWVDACARATGFWPVVLLLLIFTPYAATRTSSAWHGIRRGVGDWLSNSGDVASFIALGITFLMVPAVVAYLAPSVASICFRPDTIATRQWVIFAVSAPIQLIWALLGAFAAVAVWEFYWQIGRAERGEPPAERT